jgi:hypothetical protein
MFVTAIVEGKLSSGRREDLGRWEDGNNFGRGHLDNTWNLDMGGGGPYRSGPSFKPEQRQPRAAKPRIMVKLDRTEERTLRILY